jgi:hypothetical protein
MQSRDARIAFRGLARVLAPGTSLTGEVLNLSVGGALLLMGELLPVGRRLTVTVELGDGKPPIAVHAIVVRSRPHQGSDGAHELGVRFVRIDDDAVRRINHLVAGFAPPREPFLGRVKVLIPGLPMRVRASARERSPGTLVLESELRWLRLGAALSVEVAPGDVRAGKLAWLGVEVTPAGYARLVFTVDVGHAIAEPRAAVDAAAEVTPVAGAAARVVERDDVSVIDDDSPAIEEDIPVDDLPGPPDPSPVHAAAAAAL